MKKLVYLSLLLLTCSFIMQGKPNRGHRPKYTPPGTQWVKDSEFVDKKNVTNNNWLEFYYWVKRHSSKSHSNSMLPDTTRQNFRKPANRDLPVIGVSFEQAEAFCKWRSDRVNEFKYITEKHLKWVPDSTYNAPVVVKYTIPTKEEWDKSNSTQKGFKCSAVVFKQ